MEYDGYDRLKRTRGFVFALFGSFIFSFSSVVAATRLDWSYLLLGGLSIAAVLSVAWAVRSTMHPNQLFYILIGGACLAAEASLLSFYFGSPASFLYALATLLGGALAFKGMLDISSFDLSNSYWKPKQREPRREMPTT